MGFAPDFLDFSVEVQDSWDQVRHNGRLYISGMVGIVDTAGNELDNAEDIGDQMQNAMERIGAVLAEHGSSPEHILAATIYVTDMGQKVRELCILNDEFVCK